MGKARALERVVPDLLLRHAETAVDRRKHVHQQAFVGAKRRPCQLDR